MMELIIQAMDRNVKEWNHYLTLPFVLNKVNNHSKNLARAFKALCIYP